MRPYRHYRLRIGIGILAISLLLGWQVAAQSSLTQAQIEQSNYVQACGSCHLALPAEVMPSQTWQRLLLDNNHYGQQIPLPTGVPLQLAWNYLKQNSKSLLTRESVPFRLADSRYFKALHLQVDFPRPVRVTSCVDCHLGTDQGNFATLKPEWQ
ncbi:MAG: hypothetical protein NW237_16045 [Cyanobacteriota bacterium]|nr:hypothetical protein [Cyanobacteriota bacterium]